jgi:hypothetical protein
VQYCSEICLILLKRLVRIQALPSGPIIRILLGTASRAASPIIPTVLPKTYRRALVNRRVAISELTSVSATSIIVQMGKWRDGHNDQSTEFLR